VLDGPAAAEPVAGAGSPARSEAQAWRELALLWGAAAPAAGRDPCAALPAQGVHCWRVAGATPSLLRKLDRPGLLTLFDGAGRPAYALLVGLDERNVQLRLGSASQTLPLASLARVWRGDFATLWRLPPGAPADAARGPAGVPGGWLEQQLARVQPPAAGEAPAPLKARLQRFQGAHGLRGDGLAGPATLMQLNRALGVAEPRLAAANPEAR
jgi:general secretion pathway protein A